ncbi:OmpA family protein [Salipiger sp. 1_MG-2023]|uniref:OmpA family protein n=1 Tax=Salipiger sp. 1_MG-2023 TaxID=3062665 RepID=UPI0026E17444|nr:OmpA family protein [Salipiger sp. 1_MG-2023]MDO6586337.1 OmpA family protein [Salipiger sp. 1_MG-2023]
MPITRRLAKALLVLLAGPAAALDLALPGGARLMSETVSDPGSYAVPTGPWTQSGVPDLVVEGRILRQAWRIDSSDLTTLQILSPLRDGLVAQGYDVVFECRTTRCGGFDFRFGTEVIPAPEMYVDLTAFRFLAARGQKGDWVTLLASKSGAAGYLQLVQAGEAVAPRPEVAPVAIAPPTDIAAELEAVGHVMLPDLLFESGSVELGGDVLSLDALAGYLGDNPSRRIVFVGHTDAVGSLDANTALSKRRAGAAVSYLMQRGVAQGQVSAEGVGYLAPIASNLTPEGREANRRVEAVLLP